MGKMKQEGQQAIRDGRGLGFPVLPENDFKGRLDRVEAALEIQFGWIMEETPDKPTRKSAFVKPWLLAPIALMFLASFAFGAENVVVRYIAGEGNDATITLESDQGDDASDEAQFTMGANGLLDLSVGGTDIVSIGSGLSALVNVSLDTASAVTCTADGAAATGVYGNHHYNNAAQVMTYTLPPVAAGMIVTIGNTNIGAPGRRGDNRQPWSSRGLDHPDRSRYRPMADDSAGRYMGRWWTVRGHHGRCTIPFYSFCCNPDH